MDHFISHGAAQGSPGSDELRRLKPVRPGDALSLRVTVLEARRLHSRDDRGIVRSFVEVMTLPVASYGFLRNDAHIPLTLALRLEAPTSGPPVGRGKCRYPATSCGESVDLNQHREVVMTRIAISILLTRESIRV